MHKKVGWLCAFPCPLLLAAIPMSGFSRSNSLRMPVAEPWCRSKSCPSRAWVSGGCLNWGGYKAVLGWWCGALPWSLTPAPW